MISLAGRSQHPHVVDTRVRDGVQAVVRAGRPVAEVLSALLRDVDNEARATIARRITGIGVLRLRLSHLAIRGGARSHELVDAMIDLYVRTEEQGEAVDDDAWPSDPIERVSLMRSCPRWLVQRLAQPRGLADADAFLVASNRPGPATLRANALRIDRDALQATLRAQGIETTANTQSNTALDVVGRANLFGCDAWRAGLFEVQDAGSQLVAARCEVAPGHVVVDLCAGRGGKTLALAAQMQDRGTLHVHDVDDRALVDLRGRARRAGVTCLASGLPEPGTADVVLVDAPCSSVGVLRRWPDLRYRLAPHDVEEHARTQRALLVQGASLVKPGGCLVFATCSVLHDEGEAQLSAIPAGFSLRGHETLLPHVHGTDGFFLASWVRA